MARGRKTGGRTLGTPNKKTAAMKDAQRRLLEDANKALSDEGLQLFEGDAHALLTLAYKHPKLDLAMRLDAAKAAVRFEKPMMAQSTMDLSVKAVRGQDLSDDDLAAIALSATKQLPAPSEQPTQLEGCTENPRQKPEF
jgi:hypothetical protein